MGRLERVRVKLRKVTSVMIDISYYRLDKVHLC